MLQGATGSHLRTAYALTQNVAYLAEKHGLERLGFLTLTFADHVTDIREAQRRFNSLNTHVLRERYLDLISVVERMKSGRIHFHLLVAMKEDIRTGCDFEAFSRGDYRTAPSALRQEWGFWRKTAKLYRFGRTELLPVKSTAEGISRYVGKYIAKHIGARVPEDKGARLVRYSQGARRANSRFAWVSPRAWLWRKKLAIFAGRMGCETMDDLHTLFGPRWAYRMSEYIADEVLTAWPTEKHAIADGQEWARELPAGSVDISAETVTSTEVSLSRPPQESVAKVLRQKAGEALQAIQKKETGRGYVAFGYGGDSIPDPGRPCGSRDVGACVLRWIPDLSGTAEPESPAKG